MRINRDIILKDLLNKVKEAKRLNMKEVKFPIKELDDLAYVVYELMTEDISKLLSLKDKKEEPVVSKPVKKVRKVLEEITQEPEIVEEPKEKDNIVESSLDKPKFNVKEIEEVPEINPVEEITEEEDEPINGLFGGTW